MTFPRNRDEILHQLTAWAEAQPLVRAVVLTSSQAGDGSKVDRLSDYDVILFVTDTAPFVDDERWIGDFGTPVVMLRWVMEGSVPARYSRLVIYSDTVRIDFSLNPLEIMASPNTHEELDLGYRVLVDKDGLTASFPVPTYRTYLPTPPTEQVFLDVVENLWWNATYVPKYLWREELFTARVSHEHLRYYQLFQMLDWWLGCRNDWSINIGRDERYLQRYLPPEMWAALEETCAGGDLADNWRAFWRLTGLFREVARQVAAHLGFDYPEALDARVTAYLRHISTLERDGGRYGEIFRIERNDGDRVTTVREAIRSETPADY